MFELFIQNLIKPRTTGSIAVSSKKLAKLVTDTANLSNAKTVVELGPGTGIFTKKILEKINKNTIFFAIEINQFLASQTKKKCPNAVVYNDSASKIKKYLLKHGVNSCDCVISSLPWSNIGKKLQLEILDSIKETLNPGGQFLTYAYVPTAFIAPSSKNFKKLLESSFSFVKKTKIIWKNIPPAFVYCCVK